MLCWNIHLGKTDECQDISGCYVSGSGCLDLKIVKFQDRVHQLFFPNEASRKKALECGHWYFDNYLFIIKPWDLAMEEPKTLKVFLRHVCTLSILHIYPVAIIRLKLARLQDSILAITLFSKLSRTRRGTNSSNLERMFSLNILSGMFLFLKSLPIQKLQVDAI